MAKTEWSCAKVKCHLWEDGACPSWATPSTSKSKCSKNPNAPVVKENDNIKAI